MTKYIIGILSILIMGSCIEPFDFNTDIEYKSYPVIEGTIVDKPLDGFQYIRLSKSTSLEVRRYSGISNAIVIVHNSNGKYYTFEEVPNGNLGNYKGFIPPEDLITGAEFQLEVHIGDQVYQSEIETLLPAPDLDTLYYEIDNIAGTEPGTGTVGASFYLNFVADKNYGAFYRFIIEETHEYHSQWPIETYYDANNVFHNNVVDWSKYYCYYTENLPNIYTLSTDGFTQNTYIKYPLHFVPNTTQRLKHNYSILVKQYSLSKDAFNFWNSLRNNNQDSFDMFGKQPASINGNIYNTNNPEEKVLGYFGVSSLTTKRLTIPRGISDINYEIFQCTLNPLEFGIPWRPRPLYLRQTTLEGRTYWGTANPSCWDCTLHGGKTEKPIFFD